MVIHGARRARAFVLNLRLHERLQMRNGLRSLYLEPCDTSRSLSPFCSCLSILDTSILLEEISVDLRVSIYRPKAMLNGNVTIFHLSRQECNNVWHMRVRALLMISALLFRYI